MSKHSGFSLVEMSVVLVIIALIAAGVMSGQAFIETAKIRAIISEVSQYKTAISSFDSKYDKLPGDFDEAVAFWGGTTADGDNDGKIEFVNTLGTPTYEGYLAWQHLAYARMVEKPYLGTETTGAAELEVDVPKSIVNAGYFLDNSVFGFVEKNNLVLGRSVATSASPILVNGALSPSRAFEIDQKLDDGNPSTGSAKGQDGDGSAAEACVDDPSDDGANSEDFYKLAADGIDCTMAFEF